MELMRAALARLNPQRMEIEDESHRHAGHEGAKGGGGHFVLTIVSEQFSGKSTMARHRLVYDVLGALMKKEIHALSIKAYAPGEH